MCECVCVVCGQRRSPFLAVACLSPALPGRRILFHIRHRFLPSISLSLSFAPFYSRFLWDWSVLLLPIAPISTLLLSFQSPPPPNSADLHFPFSLFSSFSHTLLRTYTLSLSLSFSLFSLPSNFRNFSHYILFLHVLSFSNSFPLPLRRPHFNCHDPRFTGYSEQLHSPVGNQSREFENAGFWPLPSFSCVDDEAFALTILRSLPE